MRHTYRHRKNRSSPRHSKRGIRIAGGKIELLEPRQLLSTVSINFQVSGSPAGLPSGYLVDAGAVYGNRGNGQTYGWTTSNTSNMRDRNALNA